MFALLQECPTLQEMLLGQLVRTPSGERLRLHSHIPVAYADALYQTVVRLRPLLCVEVGMGFGVASLAILAALRKNGDGGRLISIDPVQSSQWKGGGSAAVEAAGMAEQHELIEDYDYCALPKLLRSGTRIDFAYIDGWHTFDYTLLDWWYIDKMLKVGGVVGFNDCSWPAVGKVIRFVLSHRKYSEIDVGLRRELEGYTRWRELLRRLTLGKEDAWYERCEDRYLRKDRDWEPEWDFFRRF